MTLTFGKNKVTRIETDTFGKIEVPADRLWGAQTQRAMEHFSISTEKMPTEVILAIVMIKKAAARVNAARGRLSEKKSKAIVAACNAVIDGKCAHDFPLSIWQSGSGTQSHMNVNEVIANRARMNHPEIHPNDDVNMSQSSNDVFPSAMHIAATRELNQKLLPVLEKLTSVFRLKTREFKGVVKLGRTHLMDATPLTLEQEFSGYISQLESSKRAIVQTLECLLFLPLGGTAVGTGINSPPGFSNDIIDEVVAMTGMPFKSAPNFFEALSSNDALLRTHGTLKCLATVLFKIANDIRWYGSGPRAGIGELNLPQNEPGSSIMPGKVNPTQCESLMMISVQVMANDSAISMSGASGNFQLNVHRPLMIFNFLQSVRILSDGMQNFSKFCIQGIKPNLKRIQSNLEQSLMLVTALSPHIGYEPAAKIAKKAHKDGSSLKEAAIALGIVSEADFDRWVNPLAMTHSSDSEFHQKR